MARVRMVTRTVDVTVCEVMCVDVTTAEVSIKSLEIGGKYPTDFDVMKALKKAYETDTFKVVNLNSTSMKEILYGMPEVDFIRMAQILPPRTATEDVEETEEVEQPQEQPKSKKTRKN